MEPVAVAVSRKKVVAEDAQQDAVVEVDLACLVADAPADVEVVLVLREADHVVLNSVDLACLVADAHADAELDQNVKYLVIKVP